MIKRPGIDRRFFTSTEVSFGTASSVATRVGIVDRMAIDGDRHLALVIAEAFERGLQAIDIALGAADQRERTDRRFIL